MPEPLSAEAREAIDELKQSVAELGNALREQNADPLTREKVETIVTDVMAAQARANPHLAGFIPGNETDADHELGEIKVRGRALNQREKLAYLHGLPAKRAARTSRRPVEDVEQFQRASDELVIIAAALGVNPRETAYFTEEYLPSLRAMDSTTAAEGDEFVPTELSPSLIERVNLDLQVAALFPEIDMPTQPYEVPGKAVSRVRLGSHAEQTADTGQTKFKVVTPGTRKVTLTAKKFAGEALFSKELDEDGIIPILPFIQEELEDYLAADLEDAHINGDAQGAHFDSDTTATDDPRKAIDGLRQHTQAGAKTDAANAALTPAMLRINRKKMGKYGIKIGDLAHILGMASYVDLLGATDVQTVDKYGPQATILTGELGKVGGVPLIVSEYVRQDLNATGVYDGTTTNRTIAITVNRKGFLRGSRRGLTVEVYRELYAESDQDAVAVTVRKAFEPRFPVASQLIVSQHYNVAT